MKVAVFLSSSPHLSPIFMADLEQLGEGLAEDGHQVIYGGTNSGCMGALARGVLSRKGHLTGVIPQMDFTEGIAQEGLSAQRIVPTLSERKTVMNNLGEAFVICPGGLGTLDEALEVMTLKSLGTLRKPILFYNFLGVWTPFMEALALLVESRMIRQPLSELVQVLDNQRELRENLKHVL